jgi:hypothetical protein
MLLYLQSVTSQGACLNFLLFDYFHFKLTFESIKEFESASVLHKLVLCTLDLAMKIFKFM